MTQTTQPATATARGPVPDGHAALEHIVEQEIALLDPRMRRNGDRLQALLHPDFAELSPTGQVYSRESVLAPTAEDTTEGMTAEELTAEIVGPGVALVTYRSHRGDRVAWRSSLWLRTDAGWLLRHHQGTPIRGIAL